MHVSLWLAVLLNGSLLLKKKNTLAECLSEVLFPKTGHKGMQFLRFLCSLDTVLKLLVTPWWLRYKEFACLVRRPGFNSWVGKIPWRREWLPQYSSWIIPDGVAWWAMAHGVIESPDTTKHSTNTHVVSEEQWFRSFFSPRGFQKAAIESPASWWVPLQA